MINSKATYEVCSKHKVNFQISRAIYIRFSILFPMLAHLSRMYVHSFVCVGDFLLLKKMDQRICIKFFVKNGIKCSKTLEMLKVAYSEYTVSQKSVYKWYKLFTEGREEVNDDARP